MKKIIQFTIIFSILIVFPLSCRAIFWDGLLEELQDVVSQENNNTEVINEINVSASTGNNVIEGGEDGQIIEGESKSSVEVKTIINGEEVESISTESNEGSIRVESKVEVDEQRNVNKELRIESPIEGEIESQGSRVMSQKSEEKPRVFLTWWLAFVDNLKSIFLGIFNIF